MTSWFRGTASSYLHEAGRQASIAALELADLATPAPIGRAGGLRSRAIDALHAAHLDFRFGRLRRHVVVQDARLGFLDVLIDQDPDDDVLEVSEAPADAEAVAFADGAVRFGVIAIDPHLAPLAGALGF